MSMTSNPYSAPRATGEVTPDERLYSLERGLLVVDTEKKIPSVCLKCASDETIVRREERMAVTASNFVMGGLGGVAGAAIANALRHGGSDMVVPVLLGAMIPVALIATVIHLRTERFVLRLPLCAACDAKWEQGVRYRRAILIGLALVGLVAIAGWLADSEAMLIVAGAAFASILVAAAIMRLPARFVVARRKARTHVHLAGTGPGVVEAIARRRAAKRAERQARERAAAAS